MCPGCRQASWWAGGLASTPDSGRLVPASGPGLLVPSSWPLWANLQLGDKVPLPLTQEMQTRVVWPGRVTQYFSLYKAFSQGAIRSPALLPHCGAPYGDRQAWLVQVPEIQTKSSERKDTVVQICCLSIPFRNCLLYFPQPCPISLLGF